MLIKLFYFCFVFFIRKEPKRRLKWKKKMLKMIAMRITMNLLEMVRGRNDGMNDFFLAVDDFNDDFQTQIDGAVLELQNARCNDDRDALGGVEPMGVSKS